MENWNDCINRNTENVFTSAFFLYLYLKKVAVTCRKCIIIMISKSSGKNLLI